MIGQLVQFFTCNGNIKLFLILIFIDPKIIYKIIVYMLLLALYFRYICQMNIFH